MHIASGQQVTDYSDADADAFAKRKGKIGTTEESSQVKDVRSRTTMQSAIYLLDLCVRDDSGLAASMRYPGAILN